MKVYSPFNWRKLSFLFIIFFTLQACHKDDPIDDLNETYAIEFKFSQFDTITQPFDKTRLKTDFQQRNRKLMQTAAEVQKGYLYYWSFNGQTSWPDIIVAGNASITLNRGEAVAEYADGWSFNEFDAGKALSVKGLEEVVFYMPLKNVTRLEELGFDISSSGTGPKNFELQYSQDGVTYIVFSENNQFENTNTAQARHTFTFAANTFNLDLKKDLFIKIVPRAGIRGSAGDYNPSTGVTKIDNFRLIGEANVTSEANILKFHYHIFDASSKLIVTSGFEPYQQDLQSLTLSLPAGTYLCAFTINSSRSELRFGEENTAEQFYVSNVFFNKNAEIFGALDTLEVKASTTVDLTFNRYFSQVRFEFTDDAQLLEQVDKLVISQLHKPYYFSPFKPGLTVPWQDETIIRQEVELSDQNRSLQFNQFMGIQLGPQEVAYEVDVWDKKDVLIRSFTVKSKIRNNIQLSFIGKLFADIAPESNFKIKINELWDGEVEVPF